MGIFDKVNLKDIDITKLIPQRPPIVMVDRLVFASEDMAQSEFVIRNDNVFVANDCLQDVGMIENIAQTAAAMFGVRFVISGDKVPVGYIGAVSNLNLYSLPKVNDKLETKIVLEKEIFNASLLKGSISVNGQLLLECEMKLFLETK